MHVCSRHVCAAPAVETRTDLFLKHITVSMVTADPDMSLVYERNAKKKKIILQASPSQQGSSLLPIIATISNLHEFQKKKHLQASACQQD